MVIDIFMCFFAAGTLRAVAFFLLLFPSSTRLHAWGEETRQQAEEATAEGREKLRFFLTLLRFPFQQLPIGEYCKLHRGKRASEEEMAEDVATAYKKVVGCVVLAALSTAVAWLVWLFFYYLVEVGALFASVLASVAWSVLFIAILWMAEQDGLM